MRRRLIRSSLAIVLGGTFLLCAVMVWASSMGIRGEAHDRLRAEAEHLAAVVHGRLDAGGSVGAAWLDQLVPADRRAVVRLDDGTTVAVGPSVGSSALYAGVPVPGYGSLVVEEPGDRVRESQLASMASIVGVGLLVAALSVVLAVREARRLTEPLEELAGTAERLGEGDFRVTPKRYGMPELDAVAEALEEGARRLEQMMALERQLTVDASHQLRTPLTALSMRLEELQATHDLAVVHEEAGAALEQVERLTAVVDDLLVQGSQWPAPDRPVALDEVVTQQVTEWLPAFQAAGRSVSSEGDSGLSAAVSTRAVGQVLSALLENSLQHGSGATVIRGRRMDGAVCLEVSDEGAGIPAGVVAHVFERGVSGGSGTGMGLARARATAEALGGRLELVSRSHARFALFLQSPRATAGSAERPAAHPVGSDAAPAAAGPALSDPQPVDPPPVAGMPGASAGSTLGNTQVR